MNQYLEEKYFSWIPYPRFGEYTGRIKCPCHYLFWKHIERLFLNIKGKAVVDMGCGPGLKSLTLALAGANVIALDNNDKRLEEFKKNLALTESKSRKLSLTIYLHDLRKKMSFLKSDFADCILCYEVIEHLNNIAVFVREMIRIIKPGGTILITTPNKNVCPVEEGERVYGERLHGHVNGYDAASLRAAFDIEGVSIEDVFFYKHSLMRACCSIIHKFMKFDRYRYRLPTVICIFLNRVLFPILYLFVQLEERLKKKRNTGKHIFIVLKRNQ
ncbi:MAG: methyltransferase domain-containing protein [Candidatus Omnitrophica bacterium]|nr:methyltransferase domain-containing protein [Candidatus Omnitrophota bacterium]MDD5429308.1 methyltransferase domain-containing protein [Candidatus Omnitrophota bacterium]